MSEGNKFKYKKINQLIIREQTALKAISAFFKTMEDYEKKNMQAISEFYREMQEASAKLPNKQLWKLFGNFSIHQTERTHGEANLALINEKLNFWLEGSLERLKSLHEKSKRLESGKQLTAKEIDDFKAELTEEILQVNRLKESVLNLYCHSMIKNSSMQLQELTSKIQTEFERRNIPPSGMKK